MPVGLSEAVVGVTLVGPAVGEMIHAATIALVGEVPLDAARDRGDAQAILLAGNESANATAMAGQVRMDPSVW